MITNKNNAAITYVAKSAYFSGTEKGCDQKIELTADIYVHGIPVCTLVADLYRSSNVIGKKRWYVRTKNLLSFTMPNDEELDAMLGEAQEISEDELALNGAELFDPRPVEPVEIM